MKSRSGKSFSLRPSRKPRRFKAKSNLSGFETLENREVMAANITATLAGGVLSVEGTAWPDNIIVNNDGMNISVEGVSIQSSGAAPRTSVPAGTVNSIKIDALSGDDYINYYEIDGAFARLLPTTIVGGWGKDTIVGGFGKDTIYGFAKDFDTAERIDNDLGLHVAPEGDYYNWGGKQEKWLKGGSSSWYFITPDGSLYKQTQAGAAVGTLVNKFDPSYYLTTSLLYDAGSGTNAAELDKANNFVSDGNEYLNWGGKQEKWFKSLAGAWHFITPDGTVYQQTQAGAATGVQVGKFDPSYWASISKIINAYERFADADTISALPGDDTIHGGPDIDDMSGGGGMDTLHGNAGMDYLWGGARNNDTEEWNDADTLYGGKGRDFMWGGADTDKIYGDTGNDTIWGDGGVDYLYGGTDGDVIYGGDDNDEIWGDYGIDYLYGGNHDDRLYGGMDYDYLYGESGADWLDAGGKFETAVGGTNTTGAPERDIDAWITAVAGATITDIDQTNGPTCWVLAAMGAASRTEDLSKRITYLGDYTYKVNVYQRVNLADPKAGYVLTPQYVRFDGKLIDKSDPTWSSQEGETWMIIMHLALLQAASKWDASQNINNPNPNGTDTKFAMGMITGKVPEQTTATALGSMANLIKLTDAGKRVVVSTKPSTTSLVAKHAYVVLGTSGTGVYLYNPHGSYLTVSWSTFVKDSNFVYHV